MSWCTLQHIYAYDFKEWGKGDVYMGEKVGESAALQVQVDSWNCMLLWISMFIKPTSETEQEVV